jgi:hypothetical protein
MAENGMSIAVLFSSSTNRGGYLSSRFACSEVFEFVTSDLAKCVWQDAMTATIYVTNDVTVEISDTLTVRSNTIKAECPDDVDCSAWKYVIESSTLISAPESPSYPVVVIGVPLYVSHDQDFVIDLSASSGSGSRSWKSVHFDIQSDDVNVDALQTFLNDKFSSVSYYTIPHTMVTVGYTYLMNVKLCNYLGACSSDTKRFYVVSMHFPIVSPGRCIESHHI